MTSSLILKGVNVAGQLYGEFYESSPTQKLLVAKTGMLRDGLSLPDVFPNFWKFIEARTLTDCLTSFGRFILPASHVMRSYVAAGEKIPAEWQWRVNAVSVLFFLMFSITNAYKATNVCERIKNLCRTGQAFYYARKLYFEKPLNGRAMTLLSTGEFLASLRLHIK